MAHPERIGKYPIVRTLGEGAMGVVYEAFDPVIRRPLAVKTIRRSLIQDSSTGLAAVARFKTEAQAAGGLAHPGIAAVYEYGEDDQCAYIAMEFVSGNTLSEYISRKTVFAEDDVLAIMSQLLDALGYAHSRKVLHRDIKPANLMITRDGRLKVTDFGIARLEANGVTVEGAVIGTPGYMAPEQFGSDEIDHRVDLYAAAASLYQLLTGQLPFTGSLEQVMFKTVMTDTVPPSQLPGAQRWRHFDEVVLKGLAKNREDRFESAAAFSAALVAAAHQPVADTVSEPTLIMEPVRPDIDKNTPPAIFGGSARLGTASGVAYPDTVTPALPGGGRTISGGTSLTTMEQSAGWDRATLAQIESKLARHIGPMAKVLVQRAARETTDPHVLQDRLAAHLGTDIERSEFLGGVTSVLRTATLNPREMNPRENPDAASTRSASPSQPTIVQAPVAEEPVTQALLDHASAVLARKVGPIAKLLIKRAAAQAATRSAFSQTLSQLAADSTDARDLLVELQKLPAQR